MHFTGELTQDGGSPFSRSIQFLDNTRRMGCKLRSGGASLSVAFRSAIMEEEILPISGKCRPPRHLSRHLVFKYLSVFFFYTYVCFIYRII